MINLISKEGFSEKYMIFYFVILRKGNQINYLVIKDHIKKIAQEELRSKNWHVFNPVIEFTFLSLFLSKYLLTFYPFKILKFKYQVHYIISDK